MTRISLLFPLILGALVASRAVAAAEYPDKITLQRDEDGGRIVMACRVIDATGETVRVKLPPSDQERKYPAAQVASIETPQTADHRKGLEHFEKRDYAAARKAFEGAVSEESRTWVRRDLLALLVRCALQEGDDAAAGAYFVLLSSSDPHTAAVRWIPLVWSDQPPSPALTAAARTWRTEPHDGAKLLAASVLLFDPDHQAEAEDDLRRLAAGGRTAAMRKLAQAQLWRARLRGGDIPPEELHRWETEIDQMPESIRGGPYYVLGQARRQRREYNRAAAALLWLPLVYDHDPRLAARAALEAADALRTTGRLSEAATLYREVAERFRQTPSAAAALVALNELARRSRKGTE